MGTYDNLVNVLEDLGEADALLLGYVLLVSDVHTLAYGPRPPCFSHFTLGRGCVW